jgi:hypothetical protein
MLLCGILNSCQHQVDHQQDNLVRSHYQPAEQSFEVIMHDLTIGIRFGPQITLSALKLSSTSTTTTTTTTTTSSSNIPAYQSIASRHAAVPLLMMDQLEWSLPRVLCEVPSTATIAHWAETTQRMRLDLCSEAFLIVDKAQVDFV